MSESRYIEARGLKHHVRQWPSPDDQPMRIILHGWLDVSATWQRLVDYLPESWNIAAPDFRGFGLSDWGTDTYWFYDYVGDLDALLNELSPNKPVDLIAHSMGSQVAALYCGLRPERIRKAVFLDGFYLPQMAAGKAPGRVKGWLDEIREVPQAKIYEKLEDLSQKIAKRNPGLDAEGAEFVARCWAKQRDDDRWELLGDPRHTQHGPLLYRDEEAKAIFSKATAPVLFLDAGKSYLAQMSKSEVRQQRLACFANRKNISLAESGHMLHFDAPKTSAKHVAEFLNCENE